MKGIWLGFGLRGIVVIALTLCSGGNSTAGIITYIWNDDEHRGLSGSFTVKSTALHAGLIDQTDILSFSFTTPDNTYDSKNKDAVVVFQPMTPIPIDPLTGHFTSSYAALILELDGSYPNLLITAFDSPRYGINQWDENDRRGGGSGSGSWEVELPTTPVPEPTSLVLVGTASITLAAYFGWRRRAATLHGLLDPG